MEILDWEEEKDKANARFRERMTRKEAQHPELLEKMNQCSKDWRKAPDWQPFGDLEVPAGKARVVMVKNSPLFGEKVVGDFGLVDAEETIDEEWLQKHCNIKLLRPPEDAV